MKVRKLPDWVVDTYRILAENSGRSLEAELRAQLVESALARQHQFAEESIAFRRNLEARHVRLEDSTPGIVADRQQRG